MVSKNNYSEKMRKIRPQKQRFSIRKFTVGAASVLIGLTFMGVNNQEVQADTTVAPEESVKVAEATGDTDENADKLTDTLENTHPTATSELVEMSVDLSQGTVSDEKEEEPTNSVTEATSVDEAAESNQSSDHMNSAEAQVEDNNQNNVNDPTVDQDLTTPAADSTSNDSENNVAVQNEELKTQKTAPVSTPNYDTAKDQVNNYNQVTNDKFQTILNGTEKLPGLTIIEDNKVVIDTNISGVSNSIAEAEKDNNKQLANITTVLEDYWQEMDQYNKDLAEYEKARNEYIDHLKELGLWKEGDEDPLKLSQLLVLGSEENAIAKVESLSSGVTEGSGSILDNKLNIFYKISGDQKGDFLKVTYTNLQNSSYAGKKISKIIITYSDWTEKKLNNRTSGIYFNNNPLDGFFYVGATGVTIDLKLYDPEDRLITLNDNTAYITVGSLNSTGASTDYVEKAEIINSGNYRGSGVQLPESSVNVYRGQGQYGGDIVYSEKNNEIISKYELSSKDKEAATAIWGEAAVEKYTGWDEIDRKKEIFGSGLFKVSGIGVKIRFSNQVGSAWSTFSTNIPKITFDAIEPEMPNYLLIWHKTEVNLKAQTSVHIHYIDVHEEAKKGTTEFVPEHGQELLDQKQSHHDLAIDDQYFNELWAWESANYVLATEAVHPEAIQGVTTENEKHVYVYLKHGDEEATRSKEVSQVIHYVYTDGSQAAPDYIAPILVFTQSGIKDTVTGEVTWNGEWTESQRFESVVSPEIKGYQMDRPVVDAYDIIVNNSNFDQNLDKEDTVVYIANLTEEVTRTKEVNQIIHYIYEDGSQAAPDYIAPVLTFTQSGIKDTVTGEITWNGEWTESQRFESVVSPEIKGYQMDRPVVDAYDIIVNNSNFDQNLDKEDTVVYIANPTETVTRDKVVSQVIHYVYADGSQAAPDYKGVTLVFTQSGVRDTVTGEVTWNGEWTKSQRFDSVSSPEINGYHTDRPVVDSYDIVVDNNNFDQNLDKEDTVVYIANPTEEVTRTKEVNQIIHYVYEDGSQASPDYKAVTLVFTQTGTKDTVTGEVTWNGEWTESQRFEIVSSPEIKGYHTDRPVVDAYDVVVDNNNFDQNLDKEDTVVYVANPTEEVTRIKEINQIIHYVYEDGSQAAPDYKAVTLVFTQTGTKDTVTGEVTWDGEWTESQRFESAVSPEIKGYHTDRLVVDAYDIVVDNSNFDQNLDKEDTVVYVANPTEEVTRTKEVNQIIHYVYEDGSQAAPDYKGVTLVFTQTGTRDTVTGEVTWGGEWTESQRFESVSSPSIKGYHTDRPVVGAYDIVVDNSNFDQNLDKEDTVVYIVDPEKPTEPEDPEEPTEPEAPEEPTEPEDPEEPTDPEDPEEPTEPADPEEPTEPEDPEEPTDPKDPEEPTDPADPEEPTDPKDPEEPTDPKDPEEPTDPEDPEEPTEPEDPEEPTDSEEPKAPVDSEDLEDSKVPVQVESQIPIESTNDILPIPNQLSIDSSVNKVETVENKESGKVEAATTRDVSLPQTGQKHSNSGLIGLGLATIASILGLAGTRKRKKD